MASEKNIEAWIFWESLNSKISLAPMVEMCDLPFRILVRKHCVNLCWTGMINSNQWNMSKTYRNKIFQTNDLDKPLVCQISGSISSDIIRTAKDLSNFCCAIDINLGCCQKVAKRSQFGYFMVDTADKRVNVLNLLKNVVKEINVPLFVKMRMIDGDIKETVEFAKKVEETGVKLITIHGRTTEQDKNGNVNIDCISEIVKNTRIPIIANGGVKSLEEANEIMMKTGAAGVMVAQALLRNPVVFDKDCKMNQIEIAQEYISLYKQYGNDFDALRHHLFYILDSELGDSNTKRSQLGTSHTVPELESFISTLAKS